VLQRAPTVENEWSGGARSGVAVPIRSKSCVLRSVTCFTLFYINYMFYQVSMDVNGIHKHHMSNHGQGVQITILCTCLG
jgi:hypothetical protein